LHKPLFYYIFVSLYDITVPALQFQFRDMYILRRDRHRRLIHVYFHTFFVPVCMEKLQTE